MTIGYKINPPIDESGPIDNDVEFPDVNEVAKEDEVVDHAFMGWENIESNDSKDDAANSEGSEERNESINNDDSLLLSNNEEAPIERKHLARFIKED